MEVFWNGYQDRVINIALDVVGYLLAGSLWLLIYTAWRERRARRTESVAADESPAAEISPPPLQSAPTSREGRRSIEFVSFSGTPGSAGSADSPEVHLSPDTRRGRNRAEVFAVARRMLAEGASADSVKSELPISDGELALLDAKKVI